MCMAIVVSFNFMIFYFKLKIPTLNFCYTIEIIVYMEFYQKFYMWKIYCECAKLGVHEWQWIQKQEIRNAWKSDENNNFMIIV